MLNFRVDLILHIGQGWVRQNAAVPRHTRPDLHTALEPPEDIGDFSDCAFMSSSKFSEIDGCRAYGDDLKRPAPKLFKREGD
jgi:hypothetical protein